MKTEERVQRSRGPSIFQPYRDLWKFFHKQSVVPESASWIYFIAPFISFTAMLVVPILIPVLTDRPLPLSDMGDLRGRHGSDARLLCHHSRWTRHRKCLWWDRIEPDGDAWRFLLSQH